jgi:P-type E1-E2 ATPase
VFDKTGTLTVGRLHVKSSHFETVAEDKQALMEAVSDLEANSNHPVARAIRAYLPPSSNSSELSEITEIAGKGLRCLWKDKSLIAGNLALLEESGIAYPSALQEFHQTVIAVGYDGTLAAYFVLEDSPKKEGLNTIAKLRKLGARQFAILSGDRMPVVRKLADELGIQTAFGGLLPDQKMKQFEQFLGKEGAVAYVGDGINDAPVLGLADVGIAMGSGADVARETADVTLLSGGLTALPRTLDLAAATMRVVRQNLALAFLYNLLAIPVAAGLFYPLVGHVTSPMLAAAAMTVSSLSVIANSLRLRRHTSGTSRPS